MKKIIAAGAGHGALSAAINLAKSGCDVTVYEQKSRNEAGHDMVDSVDLTAFDFACIPRPPKYVCEPALRMSFTNPAKTVTLKTPERDPNTAAVYVDRKGLLRHLINEAERVGVKFVFGATVCGAVTAGNDVVGIRIGDGEKEKIVFADLVIDGAGVNSPVRRSLPERLGIINEVSENDMISIYRAFFDKTDDTVLDPPYAVHFYHMGRAGMDWVITKNSCVDVLIGKFSPFESGEIQKALEDFREEYPFIGNELLRCGEVKVIPIRSTLPKIVCSGYAAVGDSACMTVPLKGSGIELSLKAGKLLASTVLSVKDGIYTTENLWSYQYRYFTMLGNKLVIIDAARDFLTHLSPDTVDYFLESGLITEKEIAMADGDVSVTVRYILSKLKTALPKAHELLPPLLSTVKTAARRIKAADAIPLTYSEKEFAEWAQKYKN